MKAMNAQRWGGAKDRPRREGGKSRRDGCRGKWDEMTKADEQQGLRLLTTGSRPTAVVSARSRWTRLAGPVPPPSAVAAHLRLRPHHHRNVRPH